MHFLGYLGCCRSVRRSLQNCGKCKHQGSNRERVGLLQVLAYNLTYLTSYVKILRACVHCGVEKTRWPSNRAIPWEIVVNLAYSCMEKDSVTDLASKQGNSKEMYMNPVI